MMATWWGGCLTGLYSKQYNKSEFMNFSALSIKNPTPAIMLFVLLSIAGVIAFKTTAVQDFPDIDLPVVTVSATLEGAAPAQLETEVARKLEDAVATLEGVKHIHTSVRDGEVTILVQFVLEKVTAEAVNEVRNAVDQIRSDLPSDLRDPSVTKVSNAGRAVLIFTASSNKLDEQEVSWFVDNTVVKRLLTVPGIGAVKRLGGVNREVRIELDPARMAALKLTALDVSHQLKLVQQEMPGDGGT
jgi:multidrug efflux pump subunit AcrB